MGALNIPGTLAFLCTSGANHVLFMVSITVATAVGQPVVGGRVANDKHPHFLIPVSLLEYGR